MLDLLDLFARITLDTSGYEQGLSSAIAAVQNFSSGANSTLNTAMSNMANTVNNAGSDMADAIGNASTEVNNSQHQIAEHAEEDAESFSKSWNNAGNNVGEKLKSALGTITKVSAAAIGTAAAGIAALTKSAVENFGEYEQLVGGVETLFKENADTVQQYAANAYKTVGLSANEYMETVTSFSASLLQSLGGDTEAAAAVADKAITDMSDNANKMGSSMESIQNAYQGFAKQNFTMLDNLKLGYGGTKEEMQRLLDDANEFNRQQGINTDYQIENYADIVEAIHVVQDEMDITGTTAKEAASTIQGSLSSVGAAWQNLVTGIADENADFGALIDNFVESAATAMDNLLPRVKIALEGIGELVTELSPVIAEAIPELISDVLPSIVQSAVDLVTALVNALVGNGDMIVNATLDIVDMLVDTLVDNAYTITDGAVSLITSLVNGISDRLPDLIPAAVDIIGEIVLAIADNATDLFKAALKLIQALAEGLIKAIPELFKSIDEICDSIVDQFKNFEWEDVGETIVTNVTQGMINAKKIFDSAVTTVISAGANALAGITDTDDKSFGGSEHGGASSGGRRKQYAIFDDDVFGLGGFGEGYSKEVENTFNDVNKAIENGSEEIAETTKKSSEKQKSDLVQSMEALERLYKQRKLTEDQYQKQRLEYLEKHRNEESDEWTKYYDSVQTYYEKLADTEQKAAEKAAQEREKNFATIIDHYSKQASELQKKIDTFADKLTGAYKDFYTFETDEAGNITGAYATDKMAQAGKQLEEYYNQLLQFQERGIGGDMISQLADFSQEEGLATLEYWNSLTDEQIKNLQAHYDKVTDLSSKVSELIHSDEAKSTAEAFADQISSAVENDEQFKEIGGLMLSGIMDGLNSGAFDITEAASRISAAFSDYFQGGGAIPPSSTVTSPSYAQTVTTATAFPVAEVASVNTAPQTAEVSAASESGIVVDVEVNIDNFNNYTNDDIDALTDEIIIKIQEKIKQRKVAFS